MSITIEEREQIKPLGVKKHLHLVDGYIASGMDLDDLTIHYAVDQERIMLVLRGYGFYPDPWSKVQFDSKRKYKGLPYQYVEEFITAFYPGILTVEDETEKKDAAGAEMEPAALEDYLDINHPGWRNSQHHALSSLFHLSDEELQGKGYYDHPAKPARMSRGFLNLLRRNKK